MQQLGFFRCHEHDELAAVARAGRRYHIERGRFFFHQGGPARWLYLVVEGQVNLPQVTPERHQVILRLIGSGEITGSNPADTRPTVARLLACWPLVWPVFFRRRMACVGCAMAPFCSLVEVSKNHGLSLAGLMDKLQHGLETTSVQHTLWE